MSLNRYALNVGTINALRSRINRTVVRSATAVLAQPRKYIPFIRTSDDELDAASTESAFIEIATTILGKNYSYGFENKPYEFIPTVLVSKLSVIDKLPMLFVSEFTISEK